MGTIRPKLAYQAGDVISQKCLFQTIKQFAKYNDTLTLRRDGDGANDNKPRNMAVMMVLNEVGESSLNGGGARQKASAKRNIPEFIILLDDKKYCKKIIKAFSDIFTTNEAKNKKENYTLHFFQPDETTGLMWTSVNNFVEAKQKARENGKAKSTATMDTIEEEYNEELGVTLD